MEGGGGGGVAIGVDILHACCGLLCVCVCQDSALH